MKPNIRALLDRCISDGVQHTFLNTDVEVSHTDEVRLISEIENRIWLYIDEYFTFTDNNYDEIQGVANL